MTINLSKLAIAIHKAEKEIELTTVNVMKSLALQIDQSLVLNTPRDTGRAAGNWITSIKEPSREVREIESNGGIPTEDLDVIASAKLGDTIYISNNLPYIGVLNDGSSQQVAAGFVEKSIIVAEESFNSEGEL